MSLRAVVRSFGLLALLAGPVSAVAAEPQTVTYDVRDLLIAIPDHEPDAAPATQPTREAKLESILTAVQAFLPADAKIRETSGQLIITADAADHEGVKKLLDQAHADRGRQMLIDVRVLNVTDALLAGLPLDVRTAAAAASLDHGRTPADLTDEQADLFVRVAAGKDAGTPAGPRLIPKENKDASTLTMPRLTTFDAQRAEIAVRTDLAYVKGFNEVRSDDGKSVGGAAEIDTLHPGVSMNVRGRSLADGSVVALQFRLGVTQVRGIDAAKQNGGYVQRPHVSEQTFEGLYLAPRGKTLLICPTERTGETDATRHIMVLVTATRL